MKIHLYKVLDMGNCDMDNGNDAMDATVIMTEKDLRKEFNWAMAHDKIPQDLIDDYKQDPDYKHENWAGSFDNLKIGTIIDMLKDLCNYNCGEGYYILETDIEIGE